MFVEKCYYSHFVGKGNKTPIKKYSQDYKR